MFAFWAVRKDSTLLSNDQEDKVDFLAAKREGVEHAGELADIYSAQLGLPRDDLFKYLTENISYDLDGESLARAGTVLRAGARMRADRRGARAGVLRMMRKLTAIGPTALLH